MYFRKLYTGILILGLLTSNPNLLAQQKIDIVQKPATSGQQKLNIAQALQSLVPKVFSEKKNLITQPISPAELNDWKNNGILAVKKIVQDKAPQYIKQYFEPLDSANFELLNRLSIIRRYLAQFIVGNVDKGVEIDSTKIKGSDYQKQLSNQIDVAKFKKLLPEISGIIEKATPYQKNVIDIIAKIEKEKTRVKEAYFETNRAGKTEALDALYALALVLDGNYKKLFNDLNTLKILRGILK